MMFLCISRSVWNGDRKSGSILSSLGCGISCSCCWWVGIGTQCLFTGTGPRSKNLAYFKALCSLIHFIYLYITSLYFLHFFLLPGYSTDSLVLVSFLFWLCEVLVSSTELSFNIVSNSESVHPGEISLDSDSDRGWLFCSCSYEHHRMCSERF